MDKYIVDGGIPLQGEYRIKGAKNSALPIMAATVCKPGTYALYDCPRIGDVFAMEKILRFLGADTKWEGACLIIDTAGISENRIPREMMQEMRSSVFLLGSLLTRCGEARICKPGGCKIGKRPIDIHIQGLRELGFAIENAGEEVSCRGTSMGGILTLPYPSVGATENLIMAALAGKRDVTIKNCATEPEIVDFAAFLNTCGFHVQGAGTHRIFIKTGESLKPRDAMYFIMEDRIEAATYLMAVAGTGGKATFRNIRHELLQSVISVLERMGVRIKSYDNLMELAAPERLKSPGFVVTEPYPGFPTDCQPQLLTLAACASGLTTIREEIFESRFTHKKELMKMGANIDICGKNAIIKGVPFLSGTEAAALDLRGGAALVLAGLMARGRSEISNIEHISRGYEDFDKGIRSLGGLIEGTAERTKKKEKKKKKEPLS